MSTSIAKTEPNQKMSTVYLIHSIICVVLTFGIGFLPPIAGITEMGMKVLGSFLGMLYGWIFVGFIWPSLLGMIALGLSGYADVATIVGKGISNSTTLQILFTCIFFQYITDSGLSGYMSGWFVSRRINEGRPWTLIFIFLLGGTILSAFINPFAMIILLWAMMGEICNAVGYKRGDKFTGYIMCGIIFFCTLSIYMFPFLPFPIIFVGIMRTTVEFGPVPMLGWCILGPILELGLVGGFILIGKYILRVDTSKLKNIDPEYYAKLRERKMKSEEKLAMVYLIVFVSILVLPSFLPATWIFTTILQKLSVLGAALLCLTGLCFRRKGDKDVVNFPNLVYHGVSWDLIILFIATFAISPAMQSPETGILACMMTYLTPMFSGLSPMVFMIAVLLAFGLATQLIHNIILMMVFMPMLGAIGFEMGIHPALFAMIFNTMLQAAFATPGGSAQAAMMFGNTAWITRKDGYFFGSIVMVWTFVLLIGVIFPLGQILFWM